MGNPLLKASEYQYGDAKSPTTSAKDDNELSDKQNSKEDDQSSEEDAEKFKAAVQANATRLSEKKVLTKLASEALDPLRKNTIDIESCIKKAEEPAEQSSQNLIK